MNITDYLHKALRTAKYPMLNDMVKDRFRRVKNFNEYLNTEFNWIYPLVGLVGELGETANILKKVMRDYQFVITKEIRLKLKDEIGDIFWYLVVLCKELGFDPKEILEYNIKKLEKRHHINDKENL